MKSAGRRGNIGPSAGLVVLELTEPADRPDVVSPMYDFSNTHSRRPAGRFHNLSAINLNSNLKQNFYFFFIERFSMLAQVTYIQKFIMADSEDEFMLIFVAASAAFVAMSQNICRPGVGRASAGRQYQTYLIPPADGVRASARRTTPGRYHDFLKSHNRCPADTPRRPTMTGRCKIGWPTGLMNFRLYYVFEVYFCPRVLCRSVYISQN